MRRLKEVVGLFAVAALAGGCSAQTGNGQASQQASRPECVQLEETLPPTATMEGQAGEYALTLVATGGDSAGRAVSGGMWLHRQEEALRQYTVPGADPDPGLTVPLYGTADIDLDAVGAVHAGELGSLDPTQPGAMVLERRGEAEGRTFAEILVRLGAAGNRRDVLAFDGAYMVLWLRSESPEGFAGDWRSGVSGRESRGYFCAVRVGDGAP
jgi:hypothetical protein